MSPILVTAVVIVQLALVAYTTGIVIEQRTRRVTRAVLVALTAGVAFDVTATACMILGSKLGPWTPHGLLGYSALAAMAIDAARIARHRTRTGEAEVPRGLHLYSRFAYAWWVIAYLTGAALVAMNHRAGV